MKTPHWNARIRRASDLIQVYPFAAEALKFYARMAVFQESLFADFQELQPDWLATSSSGGLRDQLDLFELLPSFPGFLGLIEQSSPAPLATAAKTLRQRGSEQWQQLLDEFWRGQAVGGDEADPVLQLLAWIFLQPYAEYLASQLALARIDGTPSRCPLCGARPIVGVLRAEGDGAKKSLICMLCAHEWSFRRICCPACGEEREPQMAFYAGPEIPHVRVDVCDTCHTYMKSVDLTKTGLAIPVVDELATIPLDLWAREHGYEKLQINMLGI